MTTTAPWEDAAILGEWLALGWSREIVQGRMLARRAMGRDLVLWRDSGGTAHCWLDLCIHRGAKLSLGTVEGDSESEAECVVCPYHGWRYAADGQCVSIPAHPGMTPPAKARATSFAVRERYGVVWVCFGDAKRGLPEFPLAEETAARVMLAGPYRFRALGPRLIENFLDVGHLGIVHAGLLGDPERAEIGDYEVRMGADGPEAPAIPVWQPNPDGTGAGATVSYHYRVQGPLTSSFVKSHEGKRFGILAQVVPVDGETSEARMIMAMDYGHDVPAEELVAFQDRVAEQDRLIVESQRPELLPLDLQAELHLRSDRMAIAYRRWLREIGCRYGVA